MLFVEYYPCSKCCNPNVTYLCHHCGDCGRIFERGMCINLTFLPPFEEDQEDINNEDA